MRRPAAALATMALVLAACGGDDDDTSLDLFDEAGDEAGDQAGDDVDEPADTEPSPFDEPADEPDTDEPVSEPGSAEAQVPIAKYTAHGPGEANTVAPPCAMGIPDEQLAGEMFRVTPPATWTKRGSSGGSSYDEVRFETEDGTSIYVLEAASTEELSIVPMWEVVGPAGPEITIDGDSFPVTEVGVEDTVGYAIVDLPYLGPLPLIQGGTLLGTVAVWSDTEGRPTLEEAEQVLATVRVERCDAVGQALIYGPAGGFHAVPRFEPDPLGKTWPDEPQPAFEPTTSALEAYSVAQLAYLMPVEADVATCAAERAKEAYADTPIGHLSALRPSYDARADLESLIADC